MSQSQRHQQTPDPGVMHTHQAQGSRITPLNIMIGIVVLLIVMFLIMSLLGIGPFSWGN